MRPRAMAPFLLRLCVLTRFIGKVNVIAKGDPIAVAFIHCITKPYRVQHLEDTPEDRQGPDLGQS
jgi:hypothetical protein